MRKSPQADSSTFGPDEYWEKLECDTDYPKKCRMTWTALIKAVKKETVLCTGVFTLQEQRDNCVYEVDPLKCPNCGGTMKVISFIERNQPEVIEKILRHCDLWKETPTRAPPMELPPSPQQPAGPILYFELLSRLFPNVRYLCFALADYMLCIVESLAS